MLVLLWSVRLLNRCLFGDDFKCSFDAFYRYRRRCPQHGNWELGTRICPSLSVVDRVRQHTLKKKSPWLIHKLQDRCSPDRVDKVS